MSKQNSIKISSEHKNALCLFFKTSKQTVQDALNYENNSKLAENIRIKALALLLKESKKPSMLKKKTITI